MTLREEIERILSESAKIAPLTWDWRSPIVESILAAVRRRVPKKVEWSATDTRSMADGYNQAIDKINEAIGGGK